MKQRERVLVVDDESSVTGALEVILGEQGYEVETADTARQAQARLSARPFALVLTDLRLPDASGIDLVAAIRRESPDTEVILMTAHGSLELAIETIKLGAYYYLEKPVTPEQVVMLVERALQYAAVQRENRTLRRALTGEYQTFGIIGRNRRMHQIFETIRATAQSDAPVLIEGESGTGKELIATAFHLQSRRSAREFIRINCAAIPDDLIESELFGYRRGAFTGADRDKRGLIEAAAGGSLLLDEITEMPFHLQTKLLRVLQDHTVRRLGGEKEISVDFRLIAATNRESKQAIAAGLLREDLYYRINTIQITVPALRERLEDIVLLADCFCQRYSRKYNKRINSISQCAHQLLTRYHWPGNVRELESVIESGVLFCSGDQLTPDNLPEHLRSSGTQEVQFVVPPYFTLQEIEREAIGQTLERTGGNVKKAAQILNVHRPTFYRKLRRYDIKRSALSDQ